MWWLGLCPNHHIYDSLLWARGFFITLLGGVSGGGTQRRVFLPASAIEARRLSNRRPETALDG